MPLFLYLDEFHSFTTGSLASILSEARKYGLGSSRPAQYFDQIEIDQVRSPIFGNICCLRVSADDAEALSETVDFRADLRKRGDASQEIARIRMPRRFKQLLGLPGFDDLPVFHDGDAFTKLPHNPEVV